MSGGPGQSHRHGITLADLFRRYPDDAAAERFFINRRWPNGPRCPKCGSGNILSGARHKTMPYQCRPCRKKFSVKIGTVMEGSKLGYQNWLIAIYLFQTSLKGVSSMKLRRDLGVTQKTAWFMAHRLRECWQEYSDMFTGPVEADEAYVGGKRKNMSRKKRKEMKDAGPFAGKAIVAGVKDRDTNQVRAAVVGRTDAATLQSFVEDRVAAGAQVYTDEAKAYEGMPCFDHESVKHSAGEYVKGQAHTNGIESFWSLLKRGYIGTFHHFSEKHTDRYVTEFAGRHNARDKDTLDQMAGTIVGMVGKRLRYRDLIA